MEHQVKILDQQHVFSAQDNETILDAAIRAGISLNYGCSSGSCGLCKAQIINGDVNEIKSREFVIPEAEKLQRFILTCCCTAAADLVLDAPVAKHAAEIPEQTIKVKVRKVEQLSTQVVKLLVQTPRTQRLRFLAGQYLEITIPHVGTGKFSIASCPCEDRLIEFHLRVIKDDPISSLIADKIRLGDNLQIRGPFGEFCYDEDAHRPVILFAFDTGFAAVKSLLEHITAQEQEISIHLIWIACDENGLYLHNLCRSWQDALDGFVYDGVALKKTLKQLMLDLQQSCETIETFLVDILSRYDDLSCHDIYVSAPKPAMQLLEKVCRQKNMLERRFFAEPVWGNEDMTCIVPLA